MAKKQLLCDKPSKLMIKTQALLKESDMEVTDICLATSLPYHWLINFHKDVGNPGVNRVERLYEFLSGKPLLGE